MDLLSIIGLGIGLIIVGAITGACVICSGLTGYTARKSESLSPNDSINGNVLVVYDPGVTGAANSAASEIANDLKSQGYKVELAGVSSTVAANTSGYDIIIVGGPMYFGKVSRSIDAYLKTLTMQKEVKLGVFGTTGSSDFAAEDLESLENQVASLQSNKNASLKLIRDRNNESAIQDYKSLISAVTR